MVWASTLLAVHAVVSKAEGAAITTDLCICGPGESGQGTCRLNGAFNGIHALEGMPTDHT